MIDLDRSPIAKIAVAYIINLKVLLHGEPNNIGFDMSYFSNFVVNFECILELIFFYIVSFSKTFTRQ